MLLWFHTPNIKTLIIAESFVQKKKKKERKFCLVALVLTPEKHYLLVRQRSGEYERVVREDREKLKAYFKN